MVLKQWLNTKTATNVNVSHLVDHEKLHGLSENVLKILVNRGIDSPDAIYNFLYAGLDEMHNPSLLKDSEKFVEIVDYHLENKNKIVIHTDYDSDGGHGGAIALECFRGLNADVECYANNRFVQGYGIQRSSVDEILSKYPNTKLIITVDNGIMANDAVDYAKSKGLDVIVTDHHEPGKILPNADAVINPKRLDCNYPFDGLCGAAVIYKLMYLLYFELGEDLTIPNNTLDMVAVATIGDLVPLTDENRILVREGFYLLNQPNKRLAYQAFQEVTETAKVDSGVVGFTYVPMINAVGRLEGDILGVVEMLTATDYTKALAYAIHLFELNASRKEMTIEQVEISEKLVDKDNLPPAIVVWNENFHEGIIGLVAGRLKEKYQRPAFVFGKNDEGIWKGSARSIEGFNIKEAFEDELVNQYMLGGGGHAMAAGCAVQAENIELFKDAIVNRASKLLNEKNFIKKFPIDLALPANDITVGFVHDLEVLEPFGQAFPNPIFLMTDFKGIPSYIGKEKQHVKLDNPKISAIMWNAAEDYKKKNEPIHFRAVGYPSLNIFRNVVSVQFIINDMNLKPY